MPFAIGLVLALAVGLFGLGAGLDRDKAYYAVITIVVASYYVLFAAMGGSVHALLIECFVMSLFVAAAVVGSTSSQWWFALALAAHGALDSVHAGLINNAGVPPWWPTFCGAFDVGAAAWLAWRLRASWRMPLLTRPRWPRVSEAERFSAATTIADPGSSARD